MRIENIEDAINYVYSSYLKAEKHIPYNVLDKNKRHPEFTKDILHQLDLNYTPINILVTGSKGKGSLATMLSELLQINFKNVGLFTSPHIEEFNERIRVNGDNISNIDFIKHINFLTPIVDNIDRCCSENQYVSPIGISTLVALQYFKECHCEINILECGKGSKYDDVNQVQRDYSIILPIFLEHVRELGHSIEEIALDKSSIIKENQKCAYCSKQDPSVLEIIKERAMRKNVSLKVYGEHFFAYNIRLTDEGTVFDVKTLNNEYENLVIPLLGFHQAENAALAMQVNEDISKLSNPLKIKNKLENLNWPGRLEIIRKNPTVILDACINRASAIPVKQVIQMLGCHKIVVILGVPKDKDYVGIIDHLKDICSKVIMTESTNPHYKFEQSQMNNTTISADKISYIANLSQAISEAENSVGKNGLICILGTTALVTDVKNHYRKGGSRKDAKGLVP